MFALPQNRPTPTIHAAMLAIQYNQGSNMSVLADWLKKKGFITSNNTIYGYGTRQGVFDTAVSLGFIEKRKGGYKLTDKGKKWVDADTILEGELNAGSELHKQISSQDHTKASRNQYLGRGSEGASSFRPSGLSCG